MGCNYNAVWRINRPTGYMPQSSMLILRLWHGLKSRWLHIGVEVGWPSKSRDMALHTYTVHTHTILCTNGVYWCSIGSFESFPPSRLIARLNFLSSALLLPRCFFMSWLLLFSSVHYFVYWARSLKCFGYSGIQPEFETASWNRSFSVLQASLQAVRDAF